MSPQEKLYTMKLSKIYPALVNKALRKGRTKAEVDAVICWLLGYDETGLHTMLDRDPDYQTFFLQAPCYNKSAESIHGRICGIKVEEIQDPLYRHIRQLDKLVDELAKGKSLDAILITEKE